jgi:MFS family permease
VVDTSSDEKRGRNLGFYMFSMLAGVTLGPFIGFGLFTIFSDNGFAEMIAYRLTFIGVGIFGVFGIILLLVLVRDPKMEKLENVGVLELYSNSIKAMWNKTLESPRILINTLSSEDNEYRNRNLYVIYFVALINGLGLSLLIPIAALFLEDYYFLDPGSIAIIIGVIGVLSLFGTPFGGYLSDQFGRQLTVATSGFIGGVLMLLLGFRTSILILVVIFTLRRFMFSILSPSFRALQSDLTPEYVRGKEFGVVQASNNLGSVIGPILGGILYDAFMNVNIRVGSLEFIGAGFTFAFSGLLAMTASLLILWQVDVKSIITTDEASETL